MDKETNSQGNEEQELLKAIKIMPGQKPEVVWTTGDYLDLRDLIGNIVEYIMLEDKLILLCDEEFKLKGMTLNRRVRGLNIAGPIVFIGNSGDEEDNLASLTDEQVDGIMSEYKEVPVFTQEEKDDVKVIRTQIITW